MIGHSTIPHETCRKQEFIFILLINSEKAKWCNTKPFVRTLKNNSPKGSEKIPSREFFLYFIYFMDALSYR